MCTQSTLSVPPLSITKGDVDLVTPPSTPAGETWHYQLALPFQVAPRKAAVFCSIRQGYAPGVDFEAGADVVFLNALATVSASDAVPLTRNHKEPNPNTTPPGAPSIMVKYPARGGFVPLGAKRADGSPHPHAGTGFATNSAIAWPLQIKATPPYSVFYYRGAESYAYHELHQLAFDGQVLRVLSTEHIPCDELLPGWQIPNGAMTNAIPDGDDFLLAAPGGVDSVERGSGVMRWRRRGKEWRPVSFTPVPGTDGTGEPSLIRDVDGALLFCARGGPEPDRYDIRVWRSSDGGERWDKIIHVRGVVSGAPISLNQAPDGTPYIAANLYQVYIHPRAAHLRVLKDSAGNVRGGGWTREVLCLWPLNGERTGLGTPIVARDCRADFGYPPGGSDWRIDHPSAMTVQLADGEWHNVLGCRVLETAELTRASDPTPQTGAYLEEVTSAGKAIPIWNF